MLALLAKGVGGGASSPITKYIGYFLLLLLIVVIVLLYPWIKKYVLKMTQSLKETKKDIEKDTALDENKDPDVLQSKMDAITTRKDVQADAIALSHALGTKYSDRGHWWDFLDPQGWTENDSEVADILIRERLNYSYMQQLYFVVTRSRNLTDDILAYLDSSELQRVRKYINI